MTDRVRLVCLGLLLTSSLTQSAEVKASGSAYFDYWGMSSERARVGSIAGITPEMAIKIEAEAHEKLSFTGRICFGCHGLEVDRAHVDFTPYDQINIQAGRIGVPFGDFALRYEPTSRHTVTNPLIFEMGRMSYYQKSAFNLGVVPQPYVDTGVIVYGQFALSDTLALWYGAYGVAGFKGNNDFDYPSMRTPFYADNNKLPSWGGRLKLSYTASDADFKVRSITLGVSGMHGRYDPQHTRDYTALGVDATTRIGIATIRAEVAFLRVNLDPAVSGYGYALLDPWIEKGGAYFEIEHPLFERLILVYRADALRRVGVQLPGADPRLSPDSWILRYTQALQLELAYGVYLKGEYQYSWMNDFPSFHSFHAGLGGAF